MPARHDDITDVPGIRVGQWSDAAAATGCTVILAPGGAVAAHDLRGGGPGTRETDLLDPANAVARIHAVVLAGGSAFGLDAASGVVRYLEEHDIGHVTSAGKVPIVVGAILYDLWIGDPRRRPTAADGEAAALAASEGPVEQGSVGAGTGATVAKFLGHGRVLKGGVGSASEQLASGYTIGALVAVNALGEIVDPATSETIASPRGETPGSFESTLAILRDGRRPPEPVPDETQSTTLVCVATDAPLTKGQARRVAMVAHTGVARTVRPAHLPGDGDVLFAMSTSHEAADPEERAIVSAVGALGALAVERAILKAIRSARGLAGVPSAAEWRAAGPSR